MIVDTEDCVFPRQADLEGVVEDGCLKTIRDLLRDRGVFVAGPIERLPAHIARFAFAEDFYKVAFRQLGHMTHGVSLSGVRFSDNKPDKLQETLQADLNVPLPTKYHPMVIGIAPPDANGQQIVRLKYDKMNPRQAAYGRRETHEVEATIRTIAGNLVEVAGLPQNYTDAMIVRDFATHLAGRQSGQLQMMDLEEFAVADRVDIVEKLIKDDVSNHWRVVDTCGLAVRSGDIGGDEQNLEDSDTHLLHSAVLEGQKLRNHPIVKQLITDRFYFSSVTVWTYWSGAEEQIQLKIDFKKSPKILVLTAKSARVKNEDNASVTGWTITGPPEAPSNECTRWYWERIHKLFVEQRAASIAKAKLVARLAPESPTPGGCLGLNATATQEPAT